MDRLIQMVDEAGTITGYQTLPDLTTMPEMPAPKTADPLSDNTGRAIGDDSGYIAAGCKIRSFENHGNPSVGPYVELNGDTPKRFRVPQAFRGRERS